MRAEFDNLKKLEGVLGVSFKDPQLLRQAVTHSSFVNENPECAPGSNERLELLGDAVLGLVVVEHLFRHYPQFSEGELTRLRSYLVKRGTLVKVASSFGLGDYFLMGIGERSAGGQSKERNLAGVLEAVIGAVYLDQGLAFAERVVLRLLKKEIKGIKEQGLAVDYKTSLQQRVQSQGMSSPVYRTIATEGPPHRPAFLIEVVVGDRVLGQGSGSSKRAAQQEAAQRALERLAETGSASSPVQ